MIKFSACVVAARAALGPEPSDDATSVEVSAAQHTAALAVARRVVEAVLPPRHRWAALLVASALRAVGRRLAHPVAPAALPADRDDRGR